MRQAWSEAGNEPADLISSLFTLGCVLKPGESATGERALAQAGPLVAVGYHAMVEGFAAETIRAIFPPERVEQIEQYRALYETYEPADAKYLQLHRGHLMFNRPEEVPFLTEALILGSTFTGTKDVLVDGIRRLKEAGLSQFTIQLVQGQEDALEDWADVFEAV